jgi:uncharacterized membrane protein YfcA
LLSAVTLIGSAIGAVLPLKVGNDGCARLLPPLVAFARLHFACAERVRQWALKNPQRRGTSKDAAARNGWRSVPGLVTVYGGFFGGGVNLMVMATLSLMGYQNIQQSNAIKNFLAVLIVASVFVVFIIQGGIAWPQVIICAPGAMSGGFASARAAKRMSVAWLRGMVIAVGIALTLIYTWQYWIKPFYS